MRPPPAFMSTAMHMSIQLRLKSRTNFLCFYDKPYDTTAHDDYTTSIHAKVSSTWKLHLAMQREQPQPPGFFAMLSSISRVIGNKGQANYAAANAFLDAFTSYRNATGLHKTP
ncbi:Acyl transferase/acyl hydrolase/lysophospholipase [Penicillium robsamsonii]|uniref:Acyl transferase/acyl hydrolase/lysophospholipase n=1 Tax=Penicillium robsamsonii TaxID=1792511 RepID=UPI002548149E|nr:Acyl transferase/acyl hydrolase/lysophospholipase [Penicillium robsamsonii]KAJ5822835.1 Acyl transferase/acyl hydrolase/lysophospholipase [Penicillium robsamsonii]